MNKKKKAQEILDAYEKQIMKEMSFWIEHRPSRWGVLLMDNSKNPFFKFIERKGGKKFILKFALIFSLIFVGVVPTFKLILSNIFRVWWILLFIPIIYWVLAIIFVYTRVIVITIREVIVVALANLFS